MKNNDLALKLAEIGKSLVEIASSMVENEEPKEVSTQVKKSVSKKSSKKSTEKQTAKRNNIPNSTIKGRKINSGGKRINKWVDDGTLFSDLKGTTPPAKVKPKRPSSIIEVKCTACGRTEKKHKDTIYSVAYRCDECVLSGKVGK